MKLSLIHLRSYSFYTTYTFYRTYKKIIYSLKYMNYIGFYIGVIDVHVKNYHDFVIVLKSL